jgi:hypothetical protein
MNIDYVLPPPTEDELNLGFKSNYFERLIGTNLEKKYKISEAELYDWIHHNYTSIFLTNEELPLTKYKKLINR